MHVRAAERLGEPLHVPELRVVAVAVAGDQRAQRVVEVVGPGGVVAEAAGRLRAHDLRVVQPALGDDERARPRGVHAVGELREDVPGRHVVDGVDGVEAEPVEVQVGDPRLAGLHEPLAGAVAERVVVVDRATQNVP